MAEEEVATRAPEMDAEHVPSVISSEDTKAQSGQSMGEHCTTDRPLPSNSLVAPKGSISQLNTVDCYITKPETYPQTPAKLILFLTGGTGIQSTNNQLQADIYASHGYVVIAPDQFSGDPAPNTGVIEGEDIDPSLIEQVKMLAADAVKSFLIDMWLARHTAEKVLPILQKALEGAKEEFADCVANGGGVYAAGYCFGAKYVLLLGAEQAETVLAGKKALSDDLEAGETKKGPQIKAGVIAHGTLITKEDIEAVKVPISMACVQNDSLFPNDVREQGRASLELNAVEHEILVYENVPHGFAVLGDYEDANIKEKQEQAFEQMIAWLKAH